MVRPRVAATARGVMTACMEQEVDIVSERGLMPWHARTNTSLGWAG
jgi:hypothetical protein